MSHTHFLYHIVFATKNRFPLIAESWEKELYRYLAGIIKNLGGEPIKINGIADHIHLLVRLGPTMAISAILRELKASSSRWIKENHQPKFSWQRRYGAFSASESVSEAVGRYIANQHESYRLRPSASHVAKDIRHAPHALSSFNETIFSFVETSSTVLNKIFYSFCPFDDIFPSYLI